jgi:hypothetical protein
MEVSHRGLRRAYAILVTFEGYVAALICKFVGCQRALQVLDGRDAWSPTIAAASCRLTA